MIFTVMEAAIGMSHSLPWQGGAQLQAAVSYRSICLISSLRSQRAGSALWYTHAVSLIIPQSNLVPYLLGRAQNLFPHSCAHAYSRGQEVRSIQVKPVLYFRL
jgi:hypothetical protein